jgi:hypothetical protein
VSVILSQILGIAAWFVVCVVLMSLVEHQVHCRLMHKKPRLSLLRNLKARNRIFTSHAVEHHTQYRQTFHDDPVPHGEDRGIRLNILEGIVESLPVTILVAPFSITGAVMFPLVVCLHHVIWNQIHMEMHKPEGRFFANWAAYKSVARHHFLHHRYPDKNFNVAFPIGDWIFGTVARADENDEETMRQDRIAA